MLQWLMASLHLLGLGLGLGAILTRALALRRDPLSGRLGAVFLADNLWGVAAVLWIGTGLIRAFGGLEKGSAYYLGSSMFWIKMSLLALILLLEIRPMATLIGWRLRRGRGQAIDASGAAALSSISFVQALLVVLMVFVATALARGFGA